MFAVEGSTAGVFPPASGDPSEALTLTLFCPAHCPPCSELHFVHQGYRRQNASGWVSTIRAEQPFADASQRRAKLA